MTAGSMQNSGGARTHGAPSHTMMLPPSFSQELLWLLHRASPGSVAYNVPRTRRVRGPLDVAALRRAFDALVQRHEILRTTYGTHNDEIVQIVHPSASVPFEFIDLSHVDAGARADAVSALVRARSARPFDLATDVMLRVTLVALAPADHVLLFESHHIAFDGWSRDIVYRELGELYGAFASGRAPVLPELPIQYADFAIWQRETLQGDALADLLGWWRAELGDADHTLGLPTDFPRPSSSTFDSLTRSIKLAPALRDAIVSLGQRYAATPYMVLLAAYATVLHRYSGQDDVLIGSPIAGRSRPETETLIGYFANTIVQRARFSGDPTFGAVLARLRESALGAYDHQDVPFEKLVLELEGRTPRGESPLFQVVFTQLDASSDGAATTMGDVSLEPVAFGTTTTTKFDLTLFMADRPDGLWLSLRARSDLYRGDSIERFLGHMQHVLESVIVEPETRISCVPLLTVAEQQELVAWNRTASELMDGATIVSLFDAQVTRVPTRAAVRAGTRALTFRELDELANRMANRLHALGVARGRPVVVLLDRSPELVAAFVGVMKTGAPYVPVPTDIPIARMQRYVTESGAVAIITVARFAGEFGARVATICLDRDADVLAATPPMGPRDPVSAAALAYVLFTSGSTGTPKGVAVSHRNIVHYVRAISRVLADVGSDARGDGLASLDGWRFGMVSGVGADLGNTALFPALCAGGTLHLLPTEATTEPGAFAQYMAAHDLDVLKITPSHLRALRTTGGRADDGGHNGLPNRWLVLGGEALQWDVAAQLDAVVHADSRAPRILNHYGPTETTVGCATFELTDQSATDARAYGANTVPIGRPLSATTLYVLDADGSLVPVGVPGELYVGGAGVADGYYKRPELNAKRFVELNETGRVYRTGDRVRRLANGVLEFLGRVDQQMKIRGYRVEPGEIESVLRAHEDVSDAVVIPLPEPGIGGQIEGVVAYIVPTSIGSAAAPDALIARVREWSQARLPDYMTPSTLIVIERMPLLSSGKIDRSALPVPGMTTAPAADRIRPRTDVESAIANIWSEVLKRNDVGVRDNFIDLGGHSLHAIRILGKLSRQFGVRLPLRTLFDAPTVEQLSELVTLETRLAALDQLSEVDAARLAAAPASPSRLSSASDR